MLDDIDFDEMDEFMLAEDGDESEWFSKAWNAIKDTGKSVVNKAKSAASNVGKSISNAASSAHKAVKNTINNVKDRAHATVNHVKKHV